MTLDVAWALTLVVVVAGDKIGKVLSGTDEILGVTGTLVAIAWVAVEWK